MKISFYECFSCKHFHEMSFDHNTRGDFINCNYKEMKIIIDNNDMIECPEKIDFNEEQ